VKEKNRVLIAVLCYNEEIQIRKTIERVKVAISQLPFILDIRIFDDASTDSSPRLLEKIPHVSFQINKKNLGYAGNLRRVVSHAFEEQYDYLVVIDGDGQHDPGNIEILLNKITEGYDSVIASRYGNLCEYNQKATRRIGAFLYRILLLLLGCGWVSDPTSGNFAISRSIAQFLSQLSPEYYLLDAALIFAMKLCSKELCFAPAIFYQYPDQKSMHDQFLWSLGSFFRVVQTLAKLRKTKVSNFI
jgi:glycosyltransferase involved in cell wall biosynthesis